jgi:mannose-6-phosphate isomerase-like protein (cupin superfamily)
MKQANVSYTKGFNILTGDEHSQAATMVIEPGGCEGGSDNKHRGADQWLYVQSGEGEAKINDHSHPIEAGSLVLIQRGDRHEIRNTGSTSLNTLNIYLPPAYTPDGDELPRGKSD